MFGRPVDKLKAPDRRPLASVALRDSAREYVAHGITPQRLAAIFREADMGDMERQATLFDEIEERDGHLRGEKSKRENVITDIPMVVKPADESQKAQDVAKFIQAWIDQKTDWEAVLTGMQDAVGKGFSAFEIHWDVSSGQAIIDDLEFIEQRNFIFYDNSGILRRYPLLMSDDGPVETPPWKLLFHAYGGKSGHPTRSAIYRVCAWWWMFKNYAVKDWLTFCEVYGMPLRLGKYPPGSSDADKAALNAAIQ
jgi:phage gp29-like protein